MPQYSGKRNWEGLSGADFRSHETLMVGASPVALNPSKYGAEVEALITVEGVAVRFWLDGDDPTPDEGHPLEVNDMLPLDGAAQLAKVRFISRDGKTATLQCSYGG